MSDLINLEDHKEKIRYKIYAISNQSFKDQQTSEQYLNSLLWFSLEDINNVIKAGYQKAVVQSNNTGLKLNIKHIKEELIKSALSLMPIYEDHMRSYNTGMMRAEFSNLHKFIKNFNAQIQSVIHDSSEEIYMQYSKQRKQDRINFWTIIFSGIAAFAGILTLLFH